MKKLVFSKKETISFVKKNYTQVVLWTIGAVFMIVGLVTWILTSFGTMDENMNRIFFKGMSIDFIKGWTTFVTSDCYIEPFSYALPLAILIFESFWKWLHENKPNWKITQHYRGTTNVVVGLVSVIYVIVIIVVLGNFMFTDYGFGYGFNPEFMTGLDYMVPIFIVSILLNSLIFGIQVYYYHDVLARQQDFLARKLWRRAWTALIFLLFAYVPVLILKMGFARPYWWNVHFNDGVVLDDGTIVDGETGIRGPLAMMQTRYHDEFEHYLHNQVGQEINYGWNAPVNGQTSGVDWLVQPWNKDWINYYWWETGHGWFKSNNDIYDLVTPNMHAFPSGHLVATMFTGVTFWVWFDGKHKNKKNETFKWVLYSIGLIYVLQMVFALEVSACHWWSDMAFTLFWAPIAFGLSKLTVNAIFNRINKDYHTTNW